MIEGLNLNELAAVGGLSALLLLLTAAAKALLPNLQGAATVRAVFIMGMVISLLVRLGLGKLSTPQDWVLGLLSGILAAATAVGIKRAGTSVAHPSNV